jgi:cell division transport system permease protein
MMFWKTRDLALDADPARRFLPWLVAMIVYLASLALAGMMSLSAAVDRWDRGLTGTLTVQIPAPATGTADDAVARALAALKATPGVESARVLGTDEISALLEPWLGSGTLARELPLPRLIDVRVRAAAAPDVEGLTAVVRAAAPGAVIDDHKKSLDRLIALAHTVELVALGIVVLVTLAAVATVIFITRTGLAIHAGGIELLHLIGAADGYVARQFQGQALELALKGGVIGCVLTAATVFLLGRAAAALGTGILPDFTLSPAQWGALAAVPLGVAVIGMVTARMTVMAALRALP